jgi:hypothetical protein
LAPKPGRRHYEDAFGGDERITDLNLVRRDKAAMALIDRAIRQAPQALLYTHARLPGNPILSGFYPRHVDMHRTFESDPELARSAHDMRRVSTGDQRFGRDAAGVDAGAAKRARSMIATVMPAAARRRASDGPACPVPMTMAS